VDLSLFALDAGREFGQRVAGALGVALAPHEEREFEDGEHKARPLESVRGRDVFVVASLYGEERQSVNDKLVRLLDYAGAVVSLAVLALMFWWMLPLARDMNEFGDVTADLSIPKIVYWIPVLTGIGASVLATLVFLLRGRR